MKSHKFLFIDTGLKLEPQIYNTKPIGGSELSLLLLAEGLSELNHYVTILQPNQNYTLVSPTLLLDDLRELPKYVSMCDCVVLNRTPIDLSIFPLSLPIYYFTHDAYEQPILDWLTPEAIDRLTRIICVSEWQAYTHHVYRRIPMEKICVVPNPCFKPEWCWGHERSNKNNILVFASIPFKGLYVLPDLFFDICMSTKRDDLELWVFSSHQLYNREDDERTHLALSQLQRMKGVKVHSLLPTTSLMNIFKRAHVYIHPHTYHETFGMVVAQAMSTGVIPVSTSKGAITELITHNENGLLTTGPNIEEHKTWNEFVELVGIALENKSYRLSVKAQEIVKLYNHINIAYIFLQKLRQTWRSP